MIEPTVCRMILFHPAPIDQLGSTPLAAIITHVHDNSTVNLAVFDGGSLVAPVIARHRIQIVQDGDQPELGMAEWMPFQKGQAANLSDLEPRVAEIEETLRGVSLPGDHPQRHEALEEHSG